MVDAIEFRPLRAAEIALIGEIDRSEHVDVEYRVSGGRLVSTAMNYEVPTWSHDGSGEHSVAGVIEHWQPIVEAGAPFLGAFSGDELLGLAIVDTSFEPSMAWLAFLYVSRPHRRHGAASGLWRAAEGLSRNGGAEGRYISAVPSGSAIGFYLAMGCELATEPHPDLAALEPDDIQLIYAIT